MTHEVSAELEFFAKRRTRRELDLEPRFRQRFDSCPRWNRKAAASADFWLEIGSPVRSGGGRPIGQFSDLRRHVWSGKPSGNHGFDVALALAGNGFQKLDLVFVRQSFAD
jgi:hypothetical protein